MTSGDQRREKLSDLRRKTADLRGLADLRLVVVSDGPGAGGRLLQARTPSGLAIDIALDRGADLLRLSFRGHEIGWHSPVHAPHPWPPTDLEQGLGFLRGFDGFLVTCGLDHHGVAAETSADAFRYPLRKIQVHPLHGRIAAAKATLRRAAIDWDDEGIIVVEARLRQASVFGEVLDMERRYAISLDAPRLQLTDRVVNRGYRPTRHGMLYHFNIGYPMLDCGARLTGAGWPLAQCLDDGSAQPADDHVEIVDVGCSPAAAADGLSAIGLENRDLGIGLRLRYDPVALPVTALWRAFQSGIFALGLEPQTKFATLQAQEDRSYQLDVEIEEFCGVCE